MTVLSNDEREQLVFEGIHCKLRITFPTLGVCLATFHGHDVGEFGDAPVKALSEYLAQRDSMTLFVDGRKVPGASVEVSATWAYWIQENRTKLDAVHILCGSRFIRLTASFVRRFAEVEEKMFIYTEAKAFDLAIGTAIAGRNAA
ncbi:MAG TPA: hypothetical protein VH413_08950 [Verrucomicrobiae bacterium]|jgi:hypothetical protein|nr:hypothetical protein [Verrucomicrobiae bacterium]